MPDLLWRLVEPSVLVVLGAARPAHNVIEPVPRLVRLNPWPSRQTYGGNWRRGGSQLLRTTIIQVMEDGDKHRIEFAVSDYAQIGSLQDWLSSTPGVEVIRSPGSPGPGEMGALDVLTVVVGSSGLVAAIRVIPEFLRSRRSGVSVTVTVKGEKFMMTASNVKEIMPILERLLND